jgi:hypothetical protein
MRLHLVPMTRAELAGWRNGVQGDVADAHDARVPGRTAPAWVTRLVVLHR